MAKKAVAEGMADTEAFKAALKFCSVSQREWYGDVGDKHVMLEKGMMTATDGTYTAGHPIPQKSLLCAPNYQALKSALDACKGPVDLSGTMDALKVASGRFRATVECMPFGGCAHTGPDEPIAPADYGPIIDGYLAVEPFVQDKAAQAACETVLLNANSMVATDGRSMIEYWHGVNLPPGLILPKRSLAAFKALGKRPINFGYTPERSITFWYDDGSWFKSQLYVTSWPDYARLFEKAPPRGSVPQVHEEFYTALAAVAPASLEHGAVFSDKGIRNAEGTSEYDLPGVFTKGRINCNPELFLRARQFVDRIAFYNGEPPYDRAYFYGALVRGIIMYYRQR